MIENALVVLVWEVLGAGVVFLIAFYATWDFSIGL